jgi:hypothetical protein
MGEPHPASRTGPSLPARIINAGAGELGNFLPVGHIPRTFIRAEDGPLNADG